MVDVGGKQVTHRTARSEGRIRMQPQTLQLIQEGGHKRGTSSESRESPVSWRRKKPLS